MTGPTSSNGVPGVMHYLGVDWGERRIGLAYGDEVGVATPLPAAVGPTKKARFAHIDEVIRERRIERIVVGYPLNMNGSVGFKAREVDRFIAELEGRFGLPVIRVDERLTSQVAEAGMRAAGGRSGRDERRKGTLDSRAAAVILQDYLEQEVLGGGGGA